MDQIGALNGTEKFRLTRDPTATPAQLVAITQLGDSLDRHAALRHPNYPTALLPRIIGGEDSKDRCAALRHPGIDVDQLRHYARNHDKSHRYAVASNPSLPAELYAPLAADPESLVRAGIAGNPSTSQELLTTLGHDPSDDIVNRALAKNPHCPPEIQLRLATGRPSEAMRHLVDNPSATHEALSAAAAADPYFAKCVLKRQDLQPELFEQLGRSTSIATRRLVAAHPDAPAPVLARLVDSKDAKTRQAVLHNPSCPDYIQAITALGRS